MQPLAPLTLPLQGQILIEASAGTGKTYTIAILYLRMLLERDLSVDEILIVTFTRAATEELRSRVRQRIRDALDVLEGADTDEELLRDLIAGIDNRERAVIQLSDALTRMDAAAIFTIHGFCQRMLQEHAFESGAPFTMEFLETEQLLRRQIMEDFWRHRFYKVDREEAAWARSIWDSPETLLAGLGGHLTRPGVTCVPEVNQEIFTELELELPRLFAEVQEEWQQNKNEIIRQLQENKRLSRNSTKTYGEIRLQRAIEEITCLLAADQPPLKIPDFIDLFTSSTIADSLKKTPKNAVPPDHPFFEVFDRFYSSYQQLSQARKFLVLVTARNYLQSELVSRKQAQAQLFFDDLLSQLDSGLQARDGNQLARRIGKRFPVIMVDEFQDTDPQQYRIFAAIHSRSSRKDSDNETTGEHRAAGLFLIGDPKQAIYSFRGADIFTYIQARQDTLPENQMTMDTNYRSTNAMVAAVNQLFDRPGSFLFDKGEIDFSPVQAATLADNSPLLIDNTAPAPLTCLLLPESEKKLPKGNADEQASSYSAHEIAKLLAAGLDGRAVIGDHPLRAGDIAVLVRTHAEADTMRKQLAELNISTVYYSQDSVFSSDEAGQMRLLLQGLIDLTDSAAIRSLLASNLFGFTAEQLDRLRSDEQAWETVMETMNRYQQLWQKQGFTAMFQELLTSQQVVSRFHAEGSGERVLTNLLHLAELLQEASQQYPGADGLVRWFNDQIQAPEERSDSQQLRLESDENLVKIITIHKAKGMEYPVVFLPFLWSCRCCDPRQPLAFHQPDQPEQLFIDLGSGNDEHLQLAEQERLGEDLRLLYVAVTRARYCCFFCWGRVNKMENSALCYLLHGPQLPDLEMLAHDLATLHTPAAPLHIKPFPDFFSPLSIHQDGEKTRYRVADFQGRIDSSWQITSYSRLTAHNDPHPEQPDYDRQPEETEQEPGLTRFGFPKGAAAGTCLHAILEYISFSDPADHPEIIASQLHRAGFAEQWQPVTADWMQAILHTVLAPADEKSDPGRPLSLSCLTEKQRLNEMSFYFPLNALDLNRFNRVLEDFSFNPVPDRQDILQGLMVGFIDLVFSWQGRYYIADYKSNHLGNTAADYCPDRLQQAINHHRYDLQYLIYTLALHRFLKTRIRDYSYEEHFGGVLYLFLRGMSPENTPGTGVFADKPPLPLIEQLDRCCAGQEEC